MLNLNNGVIDEIFLSDILIQLQQRGFVLEDGYEGFADKGHGYGLTSFYGSDAVVERAMEEGIAMFVWDEGAAKIDCPGSSLHNMRSFWGIVVRIPANAPYLRIQKAMPNGALDEVFEPVELDFSGRNLPQNYFFMSEVLPEYTFGVVASKVLGDTVVLQFTEYYDERDHKDSLRAILN